MLTPLDELFRYHTWATLRLIDHCLELPPAALDYTLTGTYGSVHDTIAHLVRADAWYLSLMTGVRSADVTFDMTLAELRARFVAQSEAWQRVLAHVDDYDPTLPADDDGGGIEVPHARNLLLAQALHHGDDHRTHVWSILGAKGLEVPEADVWAYWDTTYLPPAD